MSVSVTYNSYTISNIKDKFTVSQDYKNLSFSCTFLLKGSSIANLVAQSKTVEEKLSEINKDFSLIFAGNTNYNYSHSSNSGFLARPTIAKVPNQLSTSLSREYKFSVSISLPFDQSGYNFRQEGSYTVTYSANRRRNVAFKCTYTAGDANSAPQKYSANAVSWAESVLSSLGGTFEKVSENWNTEHEEKILSGALDYKEILYDQSESAVDDTEIVDSSISFGISYQNDFGVIQSVTTQPLAIITAAFSIIVDSEVSTGSSLKDVYNNKVKPLIFSRIGDLLWGVTFSLNLSNVIVQSENLIVEPYNNSLSGSISFIAPSSTENILAATEQFSETEDEGIVYEKLWDGKPYTYNLWGYGASKLLTRTVSVSKLGTPMQKAPEMQYLPTLGAVSTAPKWVKLSEVKQSSESEVGKWSLERNSGEINQKVYVTTFSQRFLFFKGGFSTL